MSSRARQLTETLSRQGVTVTSFPEVTKSIDQEETDAHHKVDLKEFVKFNFPTVVILSFVEVRLMIIGVIRSVLYAGRILFIRKRLTADVVLIRPQEYDWTPWLIAKITGLPVVLELHSIFHVERSQRWRGPAQGTRGLLSRLEKAQWQSASAIWVNSQELKSHIVASGVSPELVNWIPFGLVDNPRRYPGTRPEQGVVQFVFVGSFYPWHGVENLIPTFAELAEQVSNVELVLIGDGIMRGRCEAQVEKCGLRDRVEFTGWLSQQAMIERLRQAHVGLAPYLEINNFYFEPVKIYDYMAAGLPTIASAQGQVGNMIEAEVSGILFEAGNEKALQDEMVRLSCDGKLRTNLGAAARQRFLAQFTLDRTASRVVDVFTYAIEYRRAR